ncbi:hypothetical protein EVAR_38679_1 [Eumeta japonica]|uniref:Uncharacterized protein n=1 Tax=Eumeta variegata TaxID=151549 RepID=A0A4C1YBI2_EUMVA|nr:hypothetical protein EVAR_38679_1 [Eumeta japonica]
MDGKNAKNDVILRGTVTPPYKRHQRVPVRALPCSAAQCPQLRSLAREADKSLEGAIMRPRNRRGSRAQSTGQIPAHCLFDCVKLYPPLQHRAVSSLCPLCTQDAARIVAQAFHCEGTLFPDNNVKVIIGLMGLPEYTGSAAKSS